MKDRPVAQELIEAVRYFLEQELLPGLTDPRLKYQTLIAANVLAIAERELAADPSIELRQQEALAQLLQQSGKLDELNQQLCQMIRHGAFDDPESFRRVLAILREQVIHKLEIANPRYLKSFSSGTS